ncbi:hypothetical protein H2199_009096 [Coniosporium tulheliwenetii]|uniref:Uncharacterized protein n=1 Tax=Coniosporium tulheliwenetii TaxID=3383036 RepID=A0ACC2YG47_9PEZI|nr:hypothetical protein H2199_009096 [Cladosporium sp. JES 115]
MPSLYAMISLLALAGFALGHTCHHRPSGWKHGRYDGPTGTGLPFPAGNETGVWVTSTSTGIGYPTGYYPTTTAHWFYETSVSSVADAGQSTTTSTCTTSETVYVTTTTNTHTVTVVPEAEESGAPTTTLETRTPRPPLPPRPAQPPAPAPAGGKRGLAYNNAALCAPFVSSSAITWAYNWAQTSDGLNPKFSFMPMLWGTNSMFTGSWAKTAGDFIAGGGKELLAFNEPDRAEQANMSPATAAAAYMTHMQPFAGRARLGSPAVTNGGGSLGLNWLTSFMSACSSCQVDFVAVHWYDSVNNVEYFKKHVTNAHTKTGKPVWLTEFGTVDGSDAQKAEFLRQVLPWLDSQDFVERYAYFMVAEGMMVSGGQMSAYGAAYAT